MPSTLMHLALAEIVYQGIKDKLNIDKIQFFVGNILPDEARDKGKSHYRVISSVNSYLLPDMEIVKKELFDKNDPIKLGAYCHLYLDYHFFEDYAFDLFIFDKDNNKIINKKNGLEWETKEFWSPRVFYSSYSELNQLILNDKLVDLNDIYKMPRILPFIGNEGFDIRRERNWKDEVLSFIDEKREYTGKILEYKPSIDLIKKVADELIKEITK